MRRIRNIFLGAYIAPQIVAAIAPWRGHIQAWWDPTTTCWILEVKEAGGKFILISELVPPFAILFCAFWIVLGTAAFFLLRLKFELPLRDWLSATALSFLLSLSLVGCWFLGPDIYLDIYRKTCL